MKIVVYAICKDEKDLIPAWVESMSEADEIVVLDTGSSDGSADELRRLGVTVFEDYEGPFRFDKARNLALSHVPDDAEICVSTDIDEIFDPGWRDKLETAFKSVPGANMARYTFVFTQKEFNGKLVDNCVFQKCNAHARRGFYWKTPCHEVLLTDDPIVWCFAPDVRLVHKTVPKQRRNSYLDILEQAAKDDPTDARTAFYLGREYTYKKEWQKAIDALLIYLNNAGEFCWHDERGAVLLWIGQSYKNLGDLERAEFWALRAIAETEGREAFLFLAELYYHQKRWNEGKYYAEKALAIEDNKAFFRDPYAYQAWPYDLLAQIYFNLGDRVKAANCAALCVRYEPENKRFIDNSRFFCNNDKTLISKKPSIKIDFDAVEKRSEETAEMAVAYSATGSYLKHLEVSLYSLLRYNRVGDLVLITEGGPTDEIMRLAERFNVGRLTLIDLDEVFKKYILESSPNFNPTCSKATLGRLFLAGEMPLKKILYLDTDTIVRGNLRELWETDLTGIAGAGVIDIGALQLWGDYTKTISYGGIPQYINAGVWLANLSNLRTSGRAQQMIDQINTIPLSFADQDAINVACKGALKILDNRFNSSRSSGIAENPLISHLVSYARFWEDPAPECDIWRETAEEYRRFIEIENPEPEPVPDPVD